MSRSTVFSSLASQGVDATEFDVLDGGLSKSDVGLGNVDNVADASQTSLGIVTTGTLGSGVVFPGAIATDTHSKGGHIIQSWSKVEETIGVSGNGTPTASAAIMTCTCTGGNFLHATAIGGYAGTASGGHEGHIGMRFTNSTDGGNVDLQGSYYFIGGGQVPGPFTGYYTIPGSGTKSVNIYLLIWALEAYAMYWTPGGTSGVAAIHIVIHEIQG